MEIKNTAPQLDSYRAQLEKTEKDAAARTAKTAGNTPPQGDRVSLSSEARLRTEAYSAAMATPEIRQSKVDAIKAKVDSGEYRADSHAIAEKLLREEPGLFGAGPVPKGNKES